VVGSFRGREKKKERITGALLSTTIEEGYLAGGGVSYIQAEKTEIKPA
jgi:hypothetical protein